MRFEPWGRKEKARYTLVHTDKGCPSTNSGGGIRSMKWHSNWDAMPSTLLLNQTWIKHTSLLKCAGWLKSLGVYVSNHNKLVSYTCWNICYVSFVLKIKWEMIISTDKETKHINPNTFAGLVGKVRKKLSPEGGRKGGWRKKRAQRARRTRGSNPGPAAC